MRTGPGRWVVAVSVATMVCFETGQGQFPPESVGIEARTGYHFTYDLWAVGARIQLPIPYLRNFEIAPGGDFFLSDDEGNDVWQFNVDFIVRTFLPAGLYLGGGFSWFRDPADLGIASRTDNGSNLFAGLEFGREFRSPIRVWVEPRWTFPSTATTTFHLGLGVTALIGRR